MPQGGKRKRGGGGASSSSAANASKSRKARKLAAKHQRKAQKKLKPGNPVRAVKKSGHFGNMKSRKKRTITGKINNNIEALMAAKVLQNQGHFNMSDLLTIGKEKRRIMGKIQAEKDKKRNKKRHHRPEKVNVPRI
jgi:hypothetical protein